MLLLVEFGKVLCNHLVGDGVVLQVTLDVSLVGRHVDKSVAGEVEENDFLLARLFALQGFADSGGDGVSAFGSRDDAFGAGKEHSRFEGLQLRYVNTFHIAVLYELTDDHTSTMVTQTTSMDI